MHRREAVPHRVAEKAVESEASHWRHVTASPGEPLPAPTRAWMQSSLGHDFSGVRVHTDSRAAESARGLGAAAYAVGEHLVFGAGRYRPDDPAGLRLLAHELAHVVQAARSTTSVTGPGDAGDPGGPGEREAQHISSTLGRGPLPSISAPPDGRIQLAPEPWFRGEAIDVAPSRPGGHLHDLGDGLYLTDTPEVATNYALTRAGERPWTARRYGVLLDLDRMRVLDLTRDVRWQTFLRSRSAPGLPTNEELIRYANENYSGMFERFVQENKIRIEDYDVIKGPEFVRGGNQICIRNRAIAAQVRSTLSTLPVSPPSAAQAAAATRSSAPVVGRASATAGAPEAAAVEGELAAAEGELAAAGAESMVQAEAVAGTRVTAASLTARVAVGLLETAVLAVVTLGLEYLKRRGEQERLRRDLAAAEPRIAASIAAALPRARAMQQDPARRTVWAVVSIELRSSFTTMFGEGAAASSDDFYGASFVEPVTLSYAYLRDHRTTRGKGMLQLFPGGSATTFDVRDLVTFSLPVPYDASSLDDAARRTRMAQIEADAARPDLPSTVLQALFDERETVLRPAPVPASATP